MPLGNESLHLMEEMPATRDVADIGIHLFFSGLTIEVSSC